MARKTAKTQRGAPAQKRPLSVRALNAAKARFTRRATALVLAYVDSMRLTPKLSRAVAKLKADVAAWRARTGSDEIRVKGSVREGALASMSDRPDWVCRNCDLIMISRGRLCFLVGCDPAHNQCSYDCIELPTNHTLRRR